LSSTLVQTLTPTPPSGHKLLRALVHLIKYLKGVRQSIKEDADAHTHANTNTNAHSHSQQEAAAAAAAQAQPRQRGFAAGCGVSVDTALLKALVRAEPENVLAFLQAYSSSRVSIRTFVPVKQVN